MKHKLLLFFSCATLALSATAPALLAQESANVSRPQARFVVKRSQAVDMQTFKAQMAQSGGTGQLPVWLFDVDSSRDGNEYNGLMVGTSPFSNPASTSVPTYVIPVIIRTKTIAVSFSPKTGTLGTAPGNTTYDPTAGDTACLTAPNNVPTTLVRQSPILKPATFNFGGTSVGNTQYIDAFQRGSFWKLFGSDQDDYHVLLSPVRFLAPIVLNVPAKDGTTLTPDFALKTFGPPEDCGPLGIIDIGFFDAFLSSKVFPALTAKGVNPSNFPIFLLHNVVMASPVTNINTCCILGYHGTTIHGSGALPIQTYSPSDFESTGFFTNSSGQVDPAVLDTAVLSHEVGEWVNDPFGINPVPPWGHIGQQPGCQANLEVGDPLSGTEIHPVVMPNHFTYHLQELAFFSWFFGAPSIGVNGWFSDNGTFLTDAGPSCQ